MDRYLADPEERVPGYPNPRATPIAIYRPQPHVYTSRIPTAASPTSSIPSTRTTASSSNSFSRKSSSASSASSVSQALPWQMQLPALDQALAMPQQLNYGYDLPCEFRFVGCDYRFHPENFEAWISHTVSHFGGLPPPVSAICIFCDEGNARFETQHDPYSNWRDRMLHIGSHWAEFSTDEDTRPDFWVVAYMKENQLISREDYAHVMKHTERPYCDGLVPSDYETPVMKVKKEKNLQIPHDLQKEDREKKKARQNGNGMATPRKHRYVHVEQ